MTTGNIKPENTRSNKPAIALAATIVCVLAVIATRNAMRFEYKVDFERVEESMRKISTAQQENYKRSGKFSCDPELVKDQHPMDEYTYYWCNQKKYIGESQPTELPPTFKTVFGSNYWNAFAVSDMDGDGFIDVWTVDSTGKIVHLQDDYIDCGEHIYFGINIIHLPYGQEIVKALGGRECRPAFINNN